MNDHVFKGRYAGWWTGKLSDFAGVAVAGTLAAVLVGARRGLVITGVAFAGLKTIPGIAEIAAPALGGVTARDLSDLVALLVLVPLWFVLGARAGARGGQVALVNPAPRDLPRRAGGGLSTVLAVAGGGAAVFTVTATSCGPSPAVILVTANDGLLFAQVSEGWGDPQWARSDDGGGSWERSSRPSEVRSIERGVFEDPGPTGPLEVCASDGTCWRVRDRRVIERRAPDTDWIEEVRLSDAQFSAISTGCRGEHVGALSSIAVTDTDGAAQVVASLGADGVLARDEQGTWSRQRVLSAPPVQATSTETGASRAALLSGPVLALVLWLVGRRWLPSWREGLAVVGAGWVATIMASGAVGFMAGSGTDPVIITARIGTVGMVLTTVAALVIARRPRRPSPIPAPPKPPPPPTASQTGRAT